MVGDTGMTKVLVNFQLNIDDTVIPRIAGALRYLHPEWASLGDAALSRTFLKKILIDAVAKAEADQQRLSAEAAAAQAAQVRQDALQQIITAGQALIDVV
jgi:hypothetical protein